MRTRIWQFVIVLLGILQSCSAQDSLNVRLVGTLHDIWDDISDIAVQGNYVFCATGGSGLRILSVADPLHPTEVAWIDTHFAITVVVSGNHAYVSDGFFEDGSLLIVDVRDPLSPRRLGSCPLGAMGNDLAISGDYAYVANDSAGVRIVDISNPVLPHVVTTWRAQNYAQGIQVDSSLAYVAYEGLRILDVSDPTAPVLRGAFLDMNGAWANAVAVANGHAYLVDSDGNLVNIDVTNPALPSLNQRLSSGYFPSDVKVGGQYLYIPMGISYGVGLRIYSLADPSNLVEVASVDTLESNRVAVDADRAYLTTRSGVQILDVRNPMSPVALGSFGRLGTLKGVALAGRYAYVAQQGRGLRVIDISDSTSPVEVSHCPLTGLLGQVTVSGNFAYVMESGGRIGVVNLTIPQSPTLVGEFPIDPGTVADIATAGQYLYATLTDLDHSWYALDVINISNPASPDFVGQVTLQHGWSGIAVSGDYAYITDGSTLRVVNVTNPAAPSSVGSINLVGAGSFLTVEGHYAYVTGAGHQLMTIDVSDPASPVLESIANVAGTVMDVAVENCIAYVVSYPGSLSVFDVSDPVAPSLIGYYYGTLGDGYDIAVRNSVAYVAEGAYLSVYDCMVPISKTRTLPTSKPCSFSLEACYPNPFNASTIVRYSLPTTGPTQLTIMDILGRTQATLFNGTQSAGHHQIQWNGASLASGTYFIRLQAGDRQAVTRTLLIR